MTRKGNHRRPQESDGPGPTSTQARLGQTVADRQASQKLVQGPFGMGQVTQQEAKEAMETGAWMSYQVAAIFSVFPAVFLTQHQSHLLDPIFSAPVVGGITLTLHRVLAGLAILGWFGVPQASQVGWRPYAVLLGWSLAVGPALVKLISGGLLSLGLPSGVWVGRAALEGVTTLARWGWVLSVVNIGSESMQLLLPTTMVVPILIPYLNRPWFTNVDERIFLPIQGLLLIASALFTPRLPAIAGVPRPEVPVIAKSQRKTILTVTALLAAPILFSFVHTGHPTGHVLASRRGVTGRIVVGEELSSDGKWFRYLRADRSLLGGVWLGQEGTKGLSKQEEKAKLSTGESVYSTFVLQDLVRLAAPANRPSDAPDERALVIGLGTGLSARSLAAHDIETTVVEVDPVVYDFAREYFALPYPNGGAVLEDARKYLAKKSALKYDFIVHDVFTGGTLPAELFTAQAFEQIKSRLLPWGTLALNFAGSLQSPIAASAISTLSAAFPSCRAFTADGPPAPLDSAEFRNVVIFCSASGGPVTFRRPVKADYLPDGPAPVARRKLLDHFAEWELPEGWQGVVGKGATALQDKKLGGLAPYQEAVAAAHVKLMERVLPNGAWADFY